MEVMRMAWLAHHGIKGQQWGKRNGSPYPLKPDQLSEAEKEKAKPEGAHHKETKTWETTATGLVRQGEYWYDENGEMLANVRYEEGKQPHNDLVGTPNEVYEYYEAGKRQVNRVIRDNQGVLALMVHGGPHDKFDDKDTYPPDGFHVHEHYENGRRVKYETGKDGRPLTAEERKEHAPSLKRK